MKYLAIAALLFAGPLMSGCVTDGAGSAKSGYSARIDPYPLDAGKDCYKRPFPQCSGGADGG